MITSSVLPGSRRSVFDLTDFAVRGKNKLEVRVTNLLINRLLGTKQPDYGALRAKYGERFPGPQEWKAVEKPFPSGLLGPVKIIPYRCLRFATDPSEGRGRP